VSPKILVADDEKGIRAALGQLLEYDGYEVHSVQNAIDAIAGKDVSNAEALATALAGLRPGQTVEVAITRSDGTSATFKVKLGELTGK